MLMYIKILFAAILISLLWACESEPGSKEKEKASEKEKPQWVEMEANAGGYALNVFVLVSEVSKSEANIEYLEDTGELRVSTGEHFDLSMYEDESQMESTLNEIKNHPFYEVEVIEQTDSTLLYRYFIEDRDNDNWQFYTERSLGQPLLLVRSNKDGIFEEFYTRKMLESALKITPLK